MRSVYLLLFGVIGLLVLLMGWQVLILDAALDDLYQAGPRHQRPASLRQRPHLPPVVQEQEAGPGNNVIARDR
jgi:hypothetical protein